MRFREKCGKSFAASCHCLLLGDIQAQANPMQQVEQGANFRVATSRQGTVKAFSVKMGLVSNCSHPSIGLGDIA